jgi:hypothetical protein
MFLYLFPLISTCCILPLIPGEFWDALGCTGRLQSQRKTGENGTDQSDTKTTSRAQRSAFRHFNRKNIVGGILLFLQLSHFSVELRSRFRENQLYSLWRMTDTAEFANRLLHFTGDFTMYTDLNWYSQYPVYIGISDSDPDHIYDARTHLPLEQSNLGTNNQALHLARFNYANILFTHPQV